MRSSRIYCYWCRLAPATHSKSYPVVGVRFACDTCDPDTIEQAGDAATIRLMADVLIGLARDGIDLQDDAMVASCLMGRFKAAEIWAYQERAVALAIADMTKPPRWSNATKAIATLAGMLICAGPAVYWAARVAVAQPGDPYAWVMPLALSFLSFWALIVALILTAQFWAPWIAGRKGGRNG